MKETPASNRALRAKLRDLPREALISELQSSLDGLTREEAERRLAEYGANELAERRNHPLLALLRYFWGPIPWMIEIAAGLAAAVRHWADFAIILVLLAGNAAVGFWEEFQAGNAVAALRARLARRARVKRDGKWTTLPAREVVPGDVAHLRIGDVVPADAKLLDGGPLEVDQSALTGESLPVQRTTDQVVYSGSIVRQGAAEAVVYATGEATFFGETARLTQTARKKSHFQRAVLRIGNYLIVVAAAIAVLISVVALWRGDSAVETLRFVLILTVAAVPVAMPTVLSVTMAVGALRLARRQAVVTRLASVEELAGIDVLCSDKTGTLTENRLSLGEPWTAGDHSPAELLGAAKLASRAEDDDPIDNVILAEAEGAPPPAALEMLRYRPFDPVHKRTEAALRDGTGAEVRVTKGAPQVILGLLRDGDAWREQARGAVERFAQRGFRTLAVARSSAGQPWELLGVLPFFDPPREDSRETVRAAREMGVRTKMITGDQVAIAKETARQLGLGTNVADASLFESSDAAEDRRLAEAIETSDGFAQVFPKHKFRIIEVLQQHGHIVGMTGDGVNDAPSLKQADAGIAVSGATDAARAAADIVLLEPGLSVIVEAIRLSRKIFQRMVNYATYRITESIRVLLFMGLSILLFDFYPLTAVMIVMLAVLNDGAILSIAYDRVEGSARPDRWNLRKVLVVASVLGVIGVVESFSLFYLVKQFAGLSRELIQSLMYLKLSVAGHLTVFVARTRGPFWSVRPSKILLAAVLGTQVAATLIVVYGFLMPPIGWLWAGAVWAYALVWLFIADGAKRLAYGLLERTPRSAEPVGEAVKLAA